MLQITPVAGSGEHLSIRFKLALCIQGITLTVINRSEFTTTDEKHLLHWIALRMPSPEHPRKGNKEYQDLCNDASVGPPSTEPLSALNHCTVLQTDHNQWAKRHPWSSWRQHYIDNQERLDPEIAALVLSKYPPDRLGKGHAPIRGQKGRSRRNRRTMDCEPDEEYIDGVYDNDVERENEPLPHARRRAGGQQHVARQGRRNVAMPEEEEEGGGEEEGEEGQEGQEYEQDRTEQQNAEGEQEQWYEQGQGDEQGQEYEVQAEDYQIEAQEYEQVPEQVLHKRPREFMVSRFLCPNSSLRRSFVCPSNDARLSALIYTFSSTYCLYYGIAEQSRTTLEYSTHTR